MRRGQVAPPELSHLVKAMGDMDMSAVVAASTGATRASRFPAVFLISSLTLGVVAGATFLAFPEIDLMGRIVRAARNRGIRRLYMSCLAENSKMQAIARKHEADLRFEYGEVIGEIMPDTPNYFSIMAEAAEDRVGFMIAVLELQSRMVRAA